MRLASKDPDIRIDEAHYKPWGAFRDEKFTDWWPAHWRPLFSVAIGVTVLASTDEIGDRDGLVVLIPLHQSQKRTLSQIRELLVERHAGTKLKNMPPGQFSLSVGHGDPSTRFLRNLPKVRLLMNLYRFWLHHSDLDERQRLEETAKDYIPWANSANLEIDERERQNEVPAALKDYVKFLKKRGERRRVPLHESNETDVPNQRRQVARYIRKARQIAENVARGQFPGIY